MGPPPAHYLPLIGHQVVDAMPAQEQGATAPLDGLIFICSLFFLSSCVYSHNFPYPPYPATVFEPIVFRLHVTEAQHVEV